MKIWMDERDDEKKYMEGKLKGGMEEIQEKDDVMIKNDVNDK